MKSVAKELNIPVIALSQLSRAVESRPDRRPVLADLRESGAIEQDADLVLMIYRRDLHAAEKGKTEDWKEERTEEKADRERVAEIIIAKHRNGPTGVVNLNETDSSYTLSASLNNTLTVNQNGTGTTVLTGTNTYTGGTTIDGHVVVNPGSALGTGAITLNSGQLDIFGGSAGVTLPGLTAASGRVNLSGGFAVSGTLAVSGSATVALRRHWCRLHFHKHLSDMALCSWGDCGHETCTEPQAIIVAIASSPRSVQHLGEKDEDQAIGRPDRRAARGIVGEDCRRHPLAG